LRDYKLLLAISTVSLVWGTTYLGIRIAVESIPGWFVAGIRQSIATIILFFILLYKREFKWIGWKNLGFQVIFSLLMIVTANGLTTVAEQHISSSLASLINASSPVLVFLGSLALGLQKFSFRSLTGILVCILGIMFIFWDGLKDLANPDYRIGVILMFCAITGWSLGTIFTKKVTINTSNISLNLFYQFAFSGVFQLILASIFSEGFTPEKWTFRSISAVIYLAIFGSVSTFYAFHYALSKISPTQISILSYVNTIIAIFLGWLVLDEEISIKFIIATSLIIFGVFITNYRPKSNNKIRIKS